MLPVNEGALILMIAIALIVAEALFQVLDILGIGGIIGFVMGSLFLMDSTESMGLSVSLLTIVQV